MILKKLDNGKKLPVLVNNLIEEKNTQKQTIVTGNLYITDGTRSFTPVKVYQFASSSKKLFASLNTTAKAMDIILALQTDTKGKSTAEFTTESYDIKSESGKPLTCKIYELQKPTEKR